MRKVLLLSLFIISALVFECAYCEDNLLAVNVIGSKQQTQAQTDITLAKDENPKKDLEPAEEENPVDDSGQGMKKIKAYRELLNDKQKELEIIRLDLEKSSLLLKKKEAEKEIYQIDKALPQNTQEETSLTGSLIQGLKEPQVDVSDIKIQLLLISDSRKEGIVSLKGILYSFREGDSIVSKLTVEQIEPSGVSFKQPDGSAFKLNFIN